MRKIEKERKIEVGKLYKLASNVFPYSRNVLTYKNSRIIPFPIGTTTIAILKNGGFIWCLVENLLVEIDRNNLEDIE
jgi:hypothetical protein